MRTISLYETYNFTDAFYSGYSRFKHGSKTQARIFGRQLAEVCDFDSGSHLMFYSAPHNNVPTASNALKDYLLSGCSRQFMEKGITIEQGKIFRAYSYDDDYGKMSKEERRNAIKSDQLYIDKSFLSDKHTLVIIDDIKITGSHEERIQEILNREGIKNDVIYIYIAEYTGDDPTIEHRLNHRDVNNLIDINHIIRNEEFIFNIRVVKFILRASQEEFINFITYQSDSFNETLFSCAILNNYHNNPKYKDNFNILKTHVK